MRRTQRPPAQQSATPSVQPADAAVVCRELCKTYQGKPALDGLELTVRRGTVHAVLGPNGAGKTTAVRVLTTLLRPDSGEALVAGFSVTGQPDEVRCRIGLLGQYAALDEGLSGRENLEVFSRLYHLGGAGSRRRAGELLARFSLTDAADKLVKQYSGGMRRRLDLAVSLIVRPDILFLDEPTTGLDPRSRDEVWQAVRSLTGSGTTVVLTTQYLAEADQLADVISLLDQGRRIAEGTADELKARVGGDRIEVVIRDAERLAEAASAITRATGCPEPGVDRDRRVISAPVTDRMAALTGSVQELAAAGLEAEDIALRRPTLDDVFLTLTGDPTEPDRSGTSAAGAAATTAQAPGRP